MKLAESLHFKQKSLRETVIDALNFIGVKDLSDFDLKKEVEKIIEEYMLVERHKCANGYVFTINKRYHYDYDFTWDEQTPWEILYKKEI